MSTAEKTVPDFEIVTIEPRQPAELFVSGGTDALIQHVTECALACPVDLTTKKGRAAIASAAAKVAGSKTFVEKIGKEFVADLKRQTGEIDAERRRWCDAMDALKAQVRKPLTDWEQAEEMRIAILGTGLHDMANLSGSLPLFAPNEIRESMEKLKAIYARDWQEFKADADTIYANALKAMEAALAVRIKADADAAEVFELRKKQAERDRADAEARAKAEAEQRQREAEERRQRELKEAAERATQIAEERARAEAAKAARQIQEAEARAAREANARAQAEARVVWEREEAAKRSAAEQEAAIQRERARAEAVKREADEQAAKQAANKKHREKVHAEIGAALFAAAVDAGESDCNKHSVGRIVEAIAAGKVPHVRIEY